MRSPLFRVIQPNAMVIPRAPESLSGVLSERRDTRSRGALMSNGYDLSVGVGLRGVNAIRPDKLQESALTQRTGEPSFLSFASESLSAEIQSVLSSRPVLKGTYSMAEKTILVGVI